MRRRRAGSRASTASVDPGRGRPGRQDRSSRRAFGSVPCERTRAPVGLRGRGESLAVHRDAALPWSASARRSLRDDELGRCGERKCCAAARGAMSREINIRGTSSHSGRVAAGGSRTIRAVASIGVWTRMGGWKGGPRQPHGFSRQIPCAAPPAYGEPRMSRKGAGLLLFLGSPLAASQVIARPRWSLKPGTYHVQHGIDVTSNVTLMRTSDY